MLLYAEAYQRSSPFTANLLSHSSMFVFAALFKRSGALTPPRYLCDESPALVSAASGRGGCGGDFGHGWKRPERACLSQDEGGGGEHAHPGSAVERCADLPPAASFPPSPLLLSSLCCLPVVHPSSLGHLQVANLADFRHGLQVATDYRCISRHGRLGLGVCHSRWAYRNITTKCLLDHHVISGQDKMETVKEASHKPQGGAERYHTQP